MDINNEQFKAVEKEVINFLDDLKNDIQRQGVQGIGIEFSRIKRDNLLDEATDALANGDMLRCVIMHCMDGMSMFAKDDE
jgi:hypothetical protein